MSESQQNALKKAKEYFRYADSHPSILAWRRKAYEDYGFYDGTGQWPQAVLDIFIVDCQEIQKIIPASQK